MAPRLPTRERACVPTFRQPGRDFLRQSIVQQLDHPPEHLLLNPANLTAESSLDLFPPDLLV